MRTTAIAQKTMEELNQAMIETEIKKETKDAIIENTIKNVTNLEVQTALGIAKIKAQNVEIGANEIVRTTAVTQKAMEELNQAMIETEIKKERIYKSNA